MEIKITLAAARKNAGMTQHQLAETLGVCDSTVAHWESGRSLPNITYVTPLEEVLGMPIENVRFGKGGK